MVQEPPDPRIVALEGRVKDLERLLQLGLVGGEAGDLQAQITQQRAVLGRLIGDATLGNVLLGPFPSASSAQTLRRADGAFYQSGSIGVYPSASTLGVSANILYATPFYMPQVPNFIDEIAIEVSTINVGGAGNARLGIFEDDGTLYPGKLIKDVGVTITGLLGSHKLTVSESTPRGLKWLAVVFDVAVELRTTAVTQNAGSWAMLGTLAANLNSLMIGFQASFTYAPLPTIFPAGGTKQGSLPILYLSFKSGGWS